MSVENDIKLGSQEHYKKIVEYCTKPKPQGFGGLSQVDCSEPLIEKYTDPITAQFYKFKPQQFCPEPVFMVVPKDIDINQPIIPKKEIIQPLFDDTDEDEEYSQEDDDDGWITAN